MLRVECTTLIQQCQYPGWWNSNKYSNSLCTQTNETRVVATYTLEDQAIIA